MKIILETSNTLDQEEMSKIFDIISYDLLYEDVDAKELMDGSYRFETPFGEVFLSIENEEE